MSDIGKTLLDRAKILVKIPDAAPGTTGGIGASYGVFGKNFSFEGYVPDSNGNKKVVFGAPSLGPLKTEWERQTKNDPVEFKNKLAANFDWFRGASGGI